MIRSLKTLGLALVAVLALSALVASAASAKPKLTPENETDYPVVLKAHQKEGVTNQLDLEGGRSVKCGTATLEGTIANKAAAETSEVTATPTFAECTATILGNVTPATITINGCKFKLTADETTSGTIASEGWEVTGSVHIECEAGKELEIHVWQTSAKHLANETPICTYKVAPQTPTGDLDYRLTEKNAGGFGTSGDIKSTLTGVATTRTAGTITNCGAATQAGTLTGESVVEGFHEGNMVRGKFED